MNMELNVSDIVAKLRALDRRVQLMLIGGFLVALYFTIMGMQYRNEVQRYNAFIIQQQDLVRTINLAVRPSGDPEAELAVLQAELAPHMERISFGHPDEILAVVPEVARQSRVQLNSFSTSTAGERTFEGKEYDIYRVSVRVAGSLNNIRGFIENMNTTLAVAVTSIDLGGLDDVPSASLNFDLFVDPTPAGGGGA